MMEDASVKKIRRILKSPEAITQVSTALNQPDSATSEAEVVGLAEPNLSRRLRRDHIAPEVLERLTRSSKKLEMPRDPTQARRDCPQTYSDFNTWFRAKTCGMVHGWKNCIERSGCSIPVKACVPDGFAMG
ncbi:hypothetical protein [Pontibaca salina]|uniref:Uncharacterized protein n=1 Tax=Pontibaca salina TaxID=2795731 RepID=A0A934M2V1_9RHOB|nr:hypothetical protein [Pontibaca salina]MBI6629189.1 hypothetical protein [Pontibaca salina]